MATPTNEGARLTQKYVDDHPALTATALAEKCGIHPVQLCHLMKSRRIPTLEQAVALNKHARIPFTAWFTNPVV